MRYGRRFLKPHHITWLTSARTLKLQTSMSLVDRCKQFRQEFPGAKMNPTLLGQVYKEHKIRKKRFIFVKAAPNQDPDKRAQELATIRRKRTRAKNEGRRIIYIDETVFTRTTVAKAEWSRPKENMTVDVKQRNEPTLALLCGISKERGLEHYQIFQRSVNLDKFEEYLTNLRAANGDDPIALYMDNLGVHVSDRSKAKMREHNFQWIYSLPYEPELNPIEYVFSHIKRNFRNLRAKKFMGLIQDSHEAMVDKAVRQVKKKDIIACVDHVNDLLK